MNRKNLGFLRVFSLGITNWYKSLRVKLRRKTKYFTSSISISGFSVLVFFRHWIIFPGIAPTYVLLFYQRLYLENHRKPQHISEHTSHSWQNKYICWETSLYFFNISKSILHHHIKHQDPPNLFLVKNWHEFWQNTPGLQFLSLV